MFARWSQPPAPCDVTDVCRNVGGRCWFAAAMTFINRAYDQLPRNALLDDAYAFSTQLAATCKKPNERRALICERAPQSLSRAYHQKLTEVENDLNAYISTSSLLYFVESRATDASDKLFDVVSFDSELAPVRIVAKLSRPFGRVSAYPRAQKYRTLAITYNKNGQSQVVEFDVSAWDKLNSAAALAKAGGRFLNIAPSHVISAEAVKKSRDSVVFELRSSKHGLINEGGFSDLLIAGIYDLPLHKRKINATHFTRAYYYPSIADFNDRPPPLLFAHGVELVRFRKRAFASYTNFVRFLDDVMATDELQGATLVGGFVSVIVNNAFHALSFVVCGDTGNIVVCDPNKMSCEAMTSTWPERTLGMLMGWTAVHEIQRACLVVTRDRDAPDRGNAPPSKRVRVSESFVDLAALSLDT